MKSKSKYLQLNQFINLFLLLIVATFNGYINKEWIDIITIILFASFVENLLAYFNNKEFFLPYSSMITASSIILMIGWTKWYIPYILITLALLQKWYIKVSNRHIFNPSNFAIIVSYLIFYPKAMPIVGQLGDSGYLTIIAIIFLATITLFFANRVAISISFLLSYIILANLILPYSNPNWNLDNFLDNLYSTSFIVYTLFMITDPRVTPNSINRQILFGFLIAIITVALHYYTGVHLKNIFLALFLTNILFFKIYIDLKSEDLLKYLFFLFLSAIIVIYIIDLPNRYFNM